MMKDILQEAKQEFPKFNVFEKGHGENVRLIAEFDGGSEEYTIVRDRAKGEPAEYLKTEIFMWLNNLVQ